MTVGQLMNKLKKIPDTATVTVFNASLYVDGEYAATGVIFDSDSNTVMIDTDYVKRLGDE